MNTDEHLLLFAFKNRKNAYLFYDDLLKLLVTEPHNARLLGLAFADKSARGHVRFERALLLRGNRVSSSVTQELARRLPPRHSALIVVVAGDTASILKAMAALYDLSPLGSVPGAPDHRHAR